MPEADAADLALLIDAAHAAGEIAKVHFGRNPEVWEKADNGGPVSEADLAIDRMLNAELGDARPDYGWLSEETEDGAARLNTERLFIVDPIDGTRAFVAGRPTFSHALAVIEGGAVTAAAVHLPIPGLTFAATRGGGATVNGAPISPSLREGLSGAAVLTHEWQMKAKNWPGGVPNVVTHHRSSLAYRLCLIANGEFDAMITLRNAWEWDVAAGALIVAEAGGTVTDRNGAAPAFNNPTPKLPGMIAAPAQLHPQIMALR
ncbi:MAG: 3'(2'),5'-bisphosphate nucleotidase CysQ [Pseudomonadota bacterium]